MVLCWAPGCYHYNERETCKFFRFPKDPQLRKKWILLVRRDSEPGPGAFLCSCHFVDGNRENCPQLFEHNRNKRFTFSSPEKRKRSLKKQKDGVSTASTTARDLQQTFDEPQPSTSSQGPTVSVSDQRQPQPSTSYSERSYDQPQPSTSSQGPRVSVHEQLESQRSTSHGESTVLSTVSVDEHIPEPDPQSTSPSDLAGVNNVLLEAENYFLRQELHRKENELAYLKEHMSFDQIKNNGSLVLFYTGLPTATVFESILELLRGVEFNTYYNWKVEKLNRAEQLLLTLMKLRHNFPQLDLAQRFSISQASVSNIIITWVCLLHKVLYEKLMAKIPGRKKNRSCLPNCCSTFTNCRIIIDCTEIYTTVSRKSMAEQKVTYSSYKHRNTWKGLIGVAPNGVITYISGLYPGSTSDKRIVQHCGILDQLSAGDLVLADKGFLIRDILPPGVMLNIPPFLTTSQFTPQQVKQTECIARARIHVERAIRRMKVYKILQFIPHTLHSYAQEVFQLVGALTNLQYPLIKEVEEYYTSESE